MRAPAAQAPEEKTKKRPAKHPNCQREKYAWGENILQLGQDRHFLTSILPTLSHIGQ